MFLATPYKKALEMGWLLWIFEYSNVKILKLWALFFFQNENNTTVFFKTLLLLTVTGLRSVARFTCAQMIKSIIRLMA